MEGNYYATQLAIALAREREAYRGAGTAAERDADAHRARVRDRVTAHQTARGITTYEREDGFACIGFPDDLAVTAGPVVLLDTLKDDPESERTREGEGHGQRARVDSPEDVEMRAMRIMSMRAPVEVSAPTVVTRARSGRRPTVPPRDQACLTSYVRINGLEALVLFDSGSTTDSLSPDFAAVAKVPKFELENPAILQLGCVGSRSRINYGTKVPVVAGKFADDVYFDIVNLDRYDAVLGTPFMRKHNVQLDFSRGAVRIAGDEIITLAPAEEERAAARRNPRATARPTATATKGN